jgi:oxygen-independent coproporphyrinogen-3 oxidase
VAEADRRPSTPIGSVYVHAPFCARRCFYCDFAVEVRRRGDSVEWSRAVASELERRLSQGVVLADRIRTLYVGGGTPSLLGPEAMDRMLELLGPGRLSAPDLEWTAEANPESLTPEVARGWREAGVTRLSLGVQSFQAAPLRWMGRLHGSEGAVRAVETARAAGFEEISVDLIFALPEGVTRNWSEDLGRVIALGVPHVSLYGLTAEAGTGLGRGVEAGRLRMADDERYRDEYLEAHARLTEAGYLHYEVSNFARPGSESRHNTAYWDRSPYLGLGNGAHSFVSPMRWWNVRDWSDYRDTLARGGDPIDAVERLDRSGDRLEAIWTGLRTDRGLALDAWPGRASDAVGSWESRGLATILEGRVVLTARGWLLLDSLAVEFDAAAG